MEINVRNNNGRCAMALGGELTIYAAAELKDSLVGAIGECAEMEIDLSAVSDIDTAGLQVLVLAKRHAAASNRALHLVGHSRPVMELLELYDLAGLFGDPVVIPAQEPGRNANGGKP
jgi:anti-anti-sigma factor